MSVSIIIPTRNEEKNIAALLSRLRLANETTLGQYDAIVVDDSDNNLTMMIAAYEGAEIIKGRGLGLAQAVIDGIEASNSENIIVMDADLQHPPELIPKIIKALETHDLVVVTKHTKDSSAELSWGRKLQSSLGCLAAKMLVPISDPMTGYFGIRRECLEGVELKGMGFKIGLEIFCKAKWTSHIEIPMDFQARVDGASKGTAHSLHKHLWNLYKESLSYRVAFARGSEEWRAFYESNGWQKNWKQNIASKLTKISEEFKPQRTLDVGCGSSPNMNFLTGERVGMDINRDALEFMKKHSNADFVYGSILNIPFPEASFDLVTCIEVLEHLHPDEIDKALSELSRVLKPSSHVVIATPNYASPIWNAIELVQRLLQPGHWTSDHHTYFNRKKLNELCRGYGLREVRYDSVMRNADMIITYARKGTTNE